MERSKYRLVFILIICCATSLKASYKSEVYVSYICNTMQNWKKTIDQMNAVKVKSNEFILEIVNYEYGYVAWCLGNKREDDAEKYLDLAEQNIEYLAKKNYNISMVNSYRSAFYGYRIGLNTWKAPFLGGKSDDCAKLAIKQDPNNPYGYIQRANIQYYMPSMFGGSKAEALKLYLKAKDLMEKDNTNLKENWNYLSLLTMIAQSYSYVNELHASKACYEKILKFEPRYQWVKNELYPQLLKKLKK